MSTIVEMRASRGGGDSTSDRPRTARRARGLALPAGVVLALCIFLPALRVCGSPTYPIAVPPFWSPYVLGVGVAWLAGARSLRGAAAALVFVKVVMLLTVVGWGVVASASLDGLPFGLAFFAIGALFFAVTHGGPVEERAARATIATGVLCTAWFAMIAFDPDGMIGAWISFGASLALVVLGLEWRRRARLERDEPVPRARAKMAA
jgi:hypothetical protein